MGETGYPYVDYMPCCSHKETKVSYHWGTFCGEPPKPIHCAGAPDMDYVPYVECPDGYHCVEPAEYGDWYKYGKYCMPTGGYTPEPYKEPEPEYKEPEPEYKDYKPEYKDYEPEYKDYKPEYYPKDKKPMPSPEYYY